MEINFDDKIIVVTGAGSGIGKELSKRLHKFGAIVYAVSLYKDQLDALKFECPGINTITVDLIDWTKTSEALSVLSGKSIYGLVNNAGIAIIKPFLELTETDIDETFAINIKAIFNVTQQILPHMFSGSAIVNISSVASITALHGHAAYSATKAAVDSLTKTLALELGPRNIRANSVNPTVVLTEMGKQHWSDPIKSEPLRNRIPLHRFAEIDEVIDAIVYLLSDKSSFINGHLLAIEGGLLTQ